MGAKNFKKVKIGDIVAVHAVDLIKFSGNLSLDEDVLPVNIYGKVADVNDKRVCVVMCETAEEDMDSNFDERLYIPIGCILKIDVLKKGG